MTDMDELPDSANGFPVVAKCVNCGIYLTLDGDGTPVHVSTYDRSCRLTHLAKLDRPLCSCSDLGRDLYCDIHGGI